MPVVAIDLGTAASGYAIALPSSTNAADPSAARVLPFKPGDRSSGATEKNLTAILLDAASMRVVAFGRDARRQFYELDPAEMRRHVFLSGFKMAMSPSSRGATALADVTVMGEGANVPVPLRVAVAKTLEYIRLEAVDRAAGIGLAEASLSWVITLPAIWDNQGKYFMREAAVDAGLIPDVNSSRLALALEPEGAIISSALEAPEEVRAKLTVGQRLLVLDCGGGTVDVTVSELVAQDPPRLREILPPSGGAWGGTSVDAQFVALISQMLFAPGSGGGGGGGSDSHEDAAASAAALDAWEAAKCGWDPADGSGSGRDKIVVAGLAAVCEHVGGPEAMAARVAAYNAARGLEGAGAVAYRPRSFSLVLPRGVVQALFDACVVPICAHMQGLLTEAAELGKPVGFVFLVGGFAESLYLQSSVREALQTEDGPVAALLVPAKPVQCVNRGAALWGLFPSSFIASRIATATFAVSLCERYNEAVHEPLPSKAYLIENSQGKWVDHVLVCVQAAAGAKR
jgi:hypothetical protein